MTSDLFFSNTDYRLNDHVIFPAMDIIGFNFLVPENSTFPLHLAEINCIRKLDKTIYTMKISDAVNRYNLYINIDNTIELDLDYYTLKVIDDLNIYSGCIVMTKEFIEWLYNMSFNIIVCEEGSVIFNPSYCNIHTVLQDFRIKYNNTPINNIILNNIGCMYEGNTYTIYPDIQQKNDEVSTDYAHTIIINDKQKGANTIIGKLVGTNISFIPRTNTGADRIIFDGRSLLFTNEKDNIDV